MKYRTIYLLKNNATIRGALVEMNDAEHVESVRFFSGFKGYEIMQVDDHNNNTVIINPDEIATITLEYVPL